MNNKKLTFEELEYVQREVSMNTKNLTVTYLLAIFLGPFGIHRAYFKKKETAILKTFLSLFAAVSFAMIVLNMTTLDLNARITREILVNHATLAIAFVLPTIISVIWSFVDLFLIPKWKRDWDENNKNKAIEEVIQSRYVKEQMLKKEIDVELIEQAKLDTIKEIQKIIENLDKDELYQLGGSQIPELPVNDVENEIPNNSKNNDIEIQVEKDEINKKDVLDVVNKEEKVVEVDNDKEEKENSEEPNISVKEAIDNNIGIKNVVGYIIGSVNINTQKIIKSDFIDNTNIILADDVNETDENKMLFVKIPHQKDFKESLGLRSNPDNLGKKIEIKGVLGDYFGKPGMKKLSKFDIKDK